MTAVRQSCQRGLAVPKRRHPLHLSPSARRRLHALLDFRKQCVGAAFESAAIAASSKRKLSKGDKWLVRYLRSKGMAKPLAKRLRRSLKVEPRMQKKAKQKLTRADKMVLKHLQGMGVDKCLVSHLKHLLESRRGETGCVARTSVERLYACASRGEYEVQVVGLHGPLGIVAASPSMTTEDLAEKVNQLTGIPTLQQRLLHGKRALKPGKVIWKCGLTPLHNQITVVRTSEYPANPVIPRSILAALPHIPRRVDEWLTVQDVVWPAFPPLKPGWYRCFSHRSFRTYFWNSETGEATNDFNEARAQEHEI